MRRSSRSYRALILLEGVIAAEQGEDCISAQYDYAYGPRPPVRHRPNAEWHDPYEGIDYRISVGQGGKRRFRADQAPGPGHRPGKRKPKGKNYRGNFLHAAVQPECDVAPEYLVPPTEPPKLPAHWANLYSVPEIAAMRRSSVTFGRIAQLCDVSPDTLKAWLADAEFDEWGWKAGWGRTCEACELTYSPWSLRRAGRGVKAKWPSVYCSKICQDEYTARLGH